MPGSRAITIVLFTVMLLAGCNAPASDLPH